MSAMYDSLMEGFTEAIEDAKSKKKKLKRTKITIEPLKEFKAGEIKLLRQKMGMSQHSFAGYLGVSPKTVEAWEAGRNKPNGTASRLLMMMEADSSLTKRFQFVKESTQISM